ncbi:hypothetical protein QUA21_27710 [Microcoleus sp. Pol1B3]|uniref:hypothetical protein n=1 Tax=unclassified Microcoleus TaxID=2642155 RepID=UPI002FD44DCB
MATAIEGDLSGTIDAEKLTLTEVATIVGAAEFAEFERLWRVVPVLPRNQTDLVLTGLRQIWS